MHQHRRLGVPVALGTHVDPGHHDHHLAAGLRELDQPSYDRRAPVHVLGTRAHRDPRPRRHRHPLQGELLPLGEVDGRHDPPALGFGHRTEGAGGVAAQPDALHGRAVGSQPVRDPPDHHPGLPLGAPSGDLHQPVGTDRVEVEVELDEARTRRVRIQSRLRLQTHQQVDHPVGRQGPHGTPLLHPGQVVADRDHSAHRGEPTDPASHLCRHRPLALHGLDDHHRFAFADLVAHGDQMGGHQPRHLGRHVVHDHAASLASSTTTAAAIAPS